MWSSSHRTEYRHELGNINRAPPNRCNIRSQPLTADENVHIYSIDGKYRKKFQEITSLFIICLRLGGYMRFISLSRSFFHLLN